MKMPGKKATCRKLFSHSKQAILDSAKPPLLLCPFSTSTAFEVGFGYFVDGVSASLWSEHLLLQSWASFGKNIMEVCSEDASAHTY